MSDWSNTSSSPPGPNITADKFLKKQTKPRILEVRFGDGYSQRMLDGINTIQDSWQLSFKNRTLIEVRKITAFLEARKGVTSFTWVPPGYLDYNTLSFNSPWQATSSGKIQCTSNAHGLKDGMTVIIYGVTGVTNANGTWLIEQTTANTFVLSGSTFAGTATSGGTIVIPETRVICKDWSVETVLSETDLVTGFGTVTCTFERVYE